jgi:molybdate transport system substrate-binding protein
MNIHRKFVFFAALLVFSLPFSASADSLQLYAAGSLKAALGEVAASYEKAYKTSSNHKIRPQRHFDKGH